MTNLIDLSHPLRDGQPPYPGDPDLRILAYCTLLSGGCNVSHLSLGSHQGTHLDAPFHFFDEGKTVDQILLERFYGPASLVDLAPGDCLQPGTFLPLDLFQAHSELFHPGARVIYRTGWDRFFGTPGFFQDYPALTPEAARWIASTGIILLGTDTPSVDGAECHLLLLAEGVEIILVESLTNLDKLPRQFTFIGFPLNLAGRDGSPIRAIAAI